MGKNEEAKKIQQEFGKNALDFAENTPVIGHVTAGVYAATGDLNKAEKVAIGATKSTVVAAAGAAGVLCGPAAAACGASLATAANAGWDGVDSAVSGEKKGLINAADKVISGQASVGESFDFIAEQALTAAGK